MSGLSSFRFVRTVGTVLTADALASAAELRMPGQSAADYQLPPGTAVNAAVARAWDTMLAAHREWHKALDKLPAGDPATKVTREKWLLPLLYELGWGRVETVSRRTRSRPRPRRSAPGALPHLAPLVLPRRRHTRPRGCPCTCSAPVSALDTKTATVTARAPQSMVQDYLNRENRALWAILSNGRQLRLLRDASALSRQSYVEFDLDEIFTNQLYADFRLLFLTAHASRFTPRLTGAAAKQATAADEDSDDEDAAERTAGRAAGRTAGWNAGASRPSTSAPAPGSTCRTASPSPCNTSATASCPARTTSPCASTSPPLTTPTAICTAPCCASPTG